MFVNNINIAVVLGFVFLLLHIPVPDVLDQLLSYLSNITSGLSMLVVGLSLSRLPFREVFREKKIFLLPVLRLLVVPLLVIGGLRVLPFEVDPMVCNILILTSALPAASSQSMITEQYHTNTSAGRQGGVCDNAVQRDYCAAYDGGGAEVTGSCAPAQFYKKK